MSPCVSCPTSNACRVLRLPSPGQQVSVLAHFSDGQVRDVTPIATFASTNQEVATVDGSGLVTGLRRGLSAVTVRYLDFVESVYFTVEEQVAGFVCPDISGAVSDLDLALGIGENLTFSITGGNAAGLEGLQLWPRQGRWPTVG